MVTAVLWSEAGRGWSGVGFDFSYPFRVVRVREEDKGPASNLLSISETASASLDFYAKVRFLGASYDEPSGGEFGLYRTWI